MKCPACSKEMVEQNFGVNVNVCQNGCQGIWFEQGELRMLDEKNEGLGSALDAALRNPRNNAGQRGQITCPTCGIPMHTHRYRSAQEVNVDECYKCGGFFLDSGELTEMRDHHMSDAQVNAYAEQLINSVPGYSQAVTDMEAREKRTEAVRKLTKFLTIGYWRKKFQHA